jgi:hypothetical protein
VESAVIMARGAKITPQDIIPRRLRGGGEPSSSVTISIGTSMADARRQLFLRTFASTGGDAVRSAKMLGIAESELRAELAPLFGGSADGAKDGARAGSNGAAPAPADDEDGLEAAQGGAVRSRSAAAKPPAAKAKASKKR